MSAPASPLRIHLLRHGQTDGSREGRFCGEIDIPLNATGLAMADAFAETYASAAWTALCASPLLRTRQTAQPLADRVRLPVVLEPGLREIAYGRWDGLLESEVRTRWPEEFAAWRAHPGQVAPPGGETARAIAARALPVLEAIRARHTGGNVLVVSHKATIRILLCALLGIDVDLFRARIAQPVGALSVLAFPETGPQLERHGDTSHLPPALRQVEGT